jgi:methylenetetrahydrofolate reductase (NADPH)
LLSTALAAELCSELIAGGVEDLHFYTLNAPDLTRDVCAALGVAPKAALSQVA